LTNLPFIPGQTYKRSLIHDQYGGNRRGGISNAAQFPVIFIFSGKSGYQHGYEDHWIDQEVFCYSGEGQIDDMKFIKGNLALRDHVKTGKQVFLFTTGAKSFVKYEGELELINIAYFRGPDRNKNVRDVIKFFFKRAGATLSSNHPPEGLLTAPIDFINNPEDENEPNATERQGLVTSRVGQGKYREYILKRWNFRCAVTQYPNHGLLIASHIVPWREATNKERLDVHNGILLSPTYDALFDRHLISFKNNGKIILSNSIEPDHFQYIGVTGKESINDFSKDNYPYLDRHRELLVK
jgi:5-methylcytosine-specific restriction enzyme A